MSKSLNQKRNDILDQHTSQRSKCEVWTRCMGYYRPVSAFNTGKQGEHNSRKFYKEPENED